jgi:hypothetical protein
MPKVVTIQGGWSDGYVIAIPDERDEIILLEEPRPLMYSFNDDQAHALLSEPNRIRLPLEHVAEDQYIVKWPVREDPRYCPQCACPPESARRHDDGWKCVCRFDHAWTLHRRNLAHYPRSSWPKAIKL